MASLNCDALTDYTGGGYEYVNSYLRGQDVPSYGLASAKELQQEIDKSFNNAPPIPKNMIVYREMSGEPLAGLKPGDVFQDKGFVSTTIKSDLNFAPGASKLEIRVPKGSKGIYIQSISQYKSEQEMLLNRGSKFKVIEENPNGLVLELIP